MKIGIVTFTYGDNYGQRLQNLATQELLKKYADEVYTLPQKKPEKSVLSNIKQYVKLCLNRKLLTTLKRSKAFSEFDQMYIQYYKKTISEGHVPNNLKNEFDYFAVGSDQVWSPFSHDVNETMFLTFADSHQRIALSPSIASTTIPESKQEKYKKYFLGFPNLSVREDAGAQLIFELTGRKANVLLDPTLMFDESFWAKYCNKPNVELNSKYALVYFLGSSKTNSEIEKICRENNLTIINILSENKYLQLGPSEFLYLIKNASLVITDSYHGTIFSTIFETPFINIKREGASLDMSSRFDTLYSKLGITSRFLPNITKSNLLSMDFKMIKSKITAEQNKTFEYIEAVLSEKEV